MQDETQSIIEIALANVMTDIKKQGQMPSVEHLATHTSLHRHTIRKMTNGNRPLSLTLSNFITISAALRVPFHELIAALPQYLDTDTPMYGLIWDKEAKVFRTGHRNA
jgi:translation initiation factor 2B subunit (eIF-2B alpha/beta/delta family)